MMDKSSDQDIENITNELEDTNITSKNDNDSSFNISNSAIETKQEETKTINKLAGQSMKYSPEDNRLPNTWSRCDPVSFKLRIGPNYDKSKQKGPSSDEFYEVVGVDFFQSPNRIDNIASKVILPEEWTNVDTTHPLIPSLYIINVQIPSNFSTSFFRETTDGPGWSFVIYFRIKQEVINQLRNLETISPSLQLFVKYCMEAPELDSQANSPWKGRFKVICRMNNMEEFGLPSFITSYNSKPILIRHTSTLTRGSKYIENDINIHKFSSVPKKGLETLFTRFPKMSLSIGFCIESRTDEEMPENLFGCIDLNMPSTEWPAFDE